MTLPAGHVIYSPPPSPASPDILPSLTIHTLNEDAPLINEPINSNELVEEEEEGPMLTSPPTAAWSRSFR